MMRRNFASLDLTALSAAADDSADEDGVDLTAMDPDAASLFADVLGFADDSGELQSGVATISLDDPRGSIGCPLEMMGDKIHNPQQRCRPSSPARAVPVKTTTALPSIRPAANDPVRRSVVDFTASPTSSSAVLSSSPFASKSKLSMAASSSSSGVPICVPAKPLVPIHRNVIQSV